VAAVVAHHKTLVVEAASSNIGFCQLPAHLPQKLVGLEPMVDGKQARQEVLTISPSAQVSMGHCSSMGPWPWKLVGANGLDDHHATEALHDLLCLHAAFPSFAGSVAYDDV